MHPGGTYNFMVFSTNRDSIYQIAYGAPLSKYQKELSEVKSILSSFRFKEPKVSTVHLQLIVDTINVPFSNYSNPKYGIKLLYPRSWDVQEEVSGLVSFTKPSTPTIEFPEATFTIYGITFTKGRPHYEDFSAKQFKDFLTQSFSLLNKYQFNTTEIQITDAVKTTTNTGYPSFRLQSMVKEADPLDPTIIYQQKRLQIWIPRGINLYRLQYDSDPFKIFCIFAHSRKNGKFF